MREACQVQPIHVAAYVEALQQSHARATVTQHLAALRMLFDWLVLGHVISVNPLIPDAWPLLFSTLSREVG